MRDRDGVFGIPNAGGNVTNQPIEMIEAQFPLRIERYGMVANSGGPGRHRGAPAYIREYRMLTDDVTVVMRSDRRTHLPYGLDGGAAGTPSWNIINPGPQQRIVPVMPMGPIVLQHGEVFCHIGAGGGATRSAADRDSCDRHHCGSRDDAAKRPHHSWVACAIENPKEKLMINIRHGLFAVLALVLSGLSTAAYAEFKPSAALRSACMSDAFKLCGQHLPNMDKIHSCLVSKISETTPKCRAQYEAETKTAAKK